MLCKIPTRGHPSPARFKIEFRGNDVKKAYIDMKIYISLKEREPTESNCDKAVIDVSKNN
jgi:hypothetical protein